MVVVVGSVVDSVVGELQYVHDDDGGVVVPRRPSLQLVVLDELGSELVFRATLGGRLGHELDKALASQQYMERS